MFFTQTATSARTDILAISIFLLLRPTLHKENENFGSVRSASLLKLCALCSDLQRSTPHRRR